MMEIHLERLPPVEAGEGLHDYRLRPPLLVGEGGRRPDEGPRALRLNEVIKR